VNQLLGHLKQKISKPLLFGLYGAVGCLIAAMVLGEIFLALTKLPPSTQGSPQGTERSPQAIVLLIDSSSSMSGSKLREVKSAATSFVERQDLSQDSFAVVGFGDEVYIGSSLSSDLNTLEQAIAELDDSGTTPMALGLEAATIQLQSTNLTPNILLFTDGYPDSETATLTAAQSSKSQGINIVAVATGDADTNFLTQLTGDSELVFFANSGQFDQAFRAAEEIIYGTNLVESGQSGDYGLVYGTLRIGGWTGLLALGTSLALIVGQNQYLRRRLLTPGEGTLGIIGGLAAGLAAGAIGQLIFTPLASIPLLEVVGRILGWIILGTLVGGGMSFFIPNLQQRRALIGGGIGGGAGALGFLFAAGAFGDIAGRLVGAAILGFFIGLMIALIEALSREAWLIVHWTPKEQTKIALGATPVVLGSSDNAHIYLSKAQGFTPTTAKIYKEGETIVMQYDDEYGRQKSMKRLRHELDDGSRRKLGNITIEVKTYTSKNLPA